MCSLSRENCTDAICEPVWTLFAEADRRFHVTQHVVHVSVGDFTAVTSNTSPTQRQDNTRHQLLSTTRPRVCTDTVLTRLQQLNRLKRLVFSKDHSNFSLRMIRSI